MALHVITLFDPSHCFGSPLVFYFPVKFDFILFGVVISFVSTQVVFNIHNIEAKQSKIKRIYMK